MNLQMVGYLREVAAGELAGALPYTDLGYFQYMILENAGAYRFAHFAAGENWASWDEGILYGEKAQLRWRKRRVGAFHLVVITQEPNLPSGFTLWGTAQPVSSNETSAARILLWGEWDDTLEAWVEGRLPLKLHYPLPNNPRKRGTRPALKVEVLELIPRHPSPPGRFDPSPPPVLERYLGIEEV